MSGFLRLLLTRLPRVIKEGIRPTTNEEIARTQDLYEKSADPVKFFVEKSLESAPRNTILISKDEMYDCYKQFCRHFRLPVEAQQSFSREMTANGFHSEKHTVNKQRIYCWDNVKIVDWKIVEDNNQMTFEEIQEQEQEQEQQQKIEEQSQLQPTSDSKVEPEPEPTPT